MKVEVILFNFAEQQIYRTPNKEMGEKPDLPDGSAYAIPETLLTYEDCKKLMAIVFYMNHGNHLPEDGAFGALLVFPGQPGPEMTMIMPRSTNDIALTSLQANADRLKCTAMKIRVVRGMVKIPNEDR